MIEYICCDVKAISLYVSKSSGGEIMSTIGQRLRTARKSKKLSLLDVRDLTGLSTGNLSDLENDKFSPSANTLIQLRQVLNVSIDWMLTGNLTKDIPSEDILREKTPAYLSTDEKMLLDIYHRLDNEDRKNIIGYMNLIAGKERG
jgi:transcriptional regulator with XRE-family HTH domain